MAENQMVKIEFDFDLGNVPASAKKFAEYLRGIETSSKEAGDQLKILGDGIDKTSDKMKKSGNNIKKSNQQWTSFALVIQDLPYGFRGIQNNLPALVGGIAGAAGPIYLIASALIAFTTAYEKEITAFIYGISAVDSAQQKLNVAISTGIGVAKAETATNAALLIVINDVTKSTTDRKDALELLKDKYKGNIELQKTDIEDGKALIAITDKISEALLRKARAEAFSKLIAEEEAKIFKLQAEQGEQVVKNLGFLETSYQVLKSVGNVATTSLNVTTAAFNKQGKEITTAQGHIKLFTEKLNENTLAQIKNKDAESIDTGAPKKDNTAKEKLKAIEKANEAETKAYLNGLDERAKKEFQAGLDLQNGLESMRAAGFKNSETYYSSYRLNMASIAKYYDDKELAEQQKIQDRLATMTFDMRAKLQQGVADINTRFANQNIKNVKAELSSTLKATRGTYDAQKGAIQLGIDKLTEYRNTSKEAGYSTKEFDEAIVELGFSMEGLIDPLENFGIQFNDIMRSLQTNVLTEVGTQLGNIFSGVEVDAKPFFNFLADTLIQLGTQLIITSKLFLAFKALFSNPATAAFAIPVGIAAIAAGVALKNMTNQKAAKFADGGIVSGPTLGLMGEYPGAKTNPEVIAPLDKLKSLMGEGNGGGGTFVLRGQDLLLSVQKAQKFSKLKGQNINLV